MKNRSHLDRRDMLKGAAAAGIASLVDSWTPLQAGPVRRDLIRAENEQAGHHRLAAATTPASIRRRKYRCPWIEGYCSHTSLRAGETLAIMVSTNPPSPFVIDLYRLGYYGGKGGRHLHGSGPSRARSSPTRRSAPSGCANAAGSRPPSWSFPRTGPAASTSAS